MLRVGGLDYAPEDWTPADSLAWLKAMAWDLRGNMERRGRTGCSPRCDHTAAEAAELYPAYPYDRHQPIVGTGAVVDGVFDQDATPTAAASATAARAAFPARARRALARVGAGLGRLPALLGRGAGVGSNSWVVDAAHSATGAPLLANDPHLGISLPGIWVQMGLHCRTLSEECPLDVAGFTFSGVPGVIIGHNAAHRLGVHQPGTRRQRPVPRAGRGATGTAMTAGCCPLTIRHETIKVRGGDDFRLTIRETGHGPLLSDVSTELSSVGANARIARRRRRPRQRVRRLARLDGADPGHHRGRDLRARPRERLGGVPGGGRATSPCPRRTWSTPTGRGTSATRRRAGCRSAESGNDGLAAQRGLAGPQRLDRQVRSRSTRCRACWTPRRGSSSPPTRP